MPEYSNVTKQYTIAIDSVEYKPIIMDGPDGPILIIKPDDLPSLIGDLQAANRAITAHKILLTPEEFKAVKEARCVWNDLGASEMQTGDIVLFFKREVKAVLPNKSEMLEIRPERIGRAFVYSVENSYVFNTMQSVGKCAQRAWLDFGES